MEDALAQRPTNVEEVKSIVRKNNLIQNLGVDDEDDGEDDLKKMNNATIKSQSPFYTKSKAVFDSISESMCSNSSAEPNSYFNLAFIDFVLNNFMPYIFIWGSYSLVNMGITGITNGTIESYWGTRKGGRVKKLNLPST